MKHILLRALFAFTALGSAASTPAQTHTIVDATQAQEALKRGAQVWDGRDARDYAGGHLPGAISIGDAPKVLRDDNSEDFIAIQRIEKILGDAGLDPLRETIVYGARGTWNAYFGQYTLRYFGATRVSVFHEGIEGWQRAGLAVETAPFKAASLALKLIPAAGVAVTTKEMLERVGKRDVQIVDARTVKEFSGEDIRALRGGHIPGAINIPYEQNWVDPDTLIKLTRKQTTDSSGMSLKAVADLKALYAKLDPDKETVVYCQSGARASETAGVLQQLGFKNVKVYDSSWIGYGNTLDAPANNANVFSSDSIFACMPAIRALSAPTLKKVALLAGASSVLP